MFENISENLQEYSGLLISASNACPLPTFRWSKFGSKILGESSTQARRRPSVQGGMGGSALRPLRVDFSNVTFPANRADSTVTFIRRIRSGEFDQCQHVNPESSMLIDDYIEGPSTKR